MPSLRLRRTLVALALAPTIACAGGSRDPLVIDPDPRPHGDLPPPPVVTEMPAYRFAPVVHGDRSWPGRDRVDLRSLPPVARSSQCARPPRGFEPIPAPVPPPPKRSVPPPKPFEKRDGGSAALRGGTTTPGAEGAATGTKLADTTPADRGWSGGDAAGNSPSPATPAGGAGYAGETKKNRRQAQSSGRAGGRERARNAPESASAPAMEPSADFSAEAEEAPVDRDAKGEAYYDDAVRYDDDYEARDDVQEVAREPSKAQRRKDEREARALAREIEKEQRRAAREKRPLDPIEPDRPEDRPVDGYEPTDHTEPLVVAQEPEYPPPGEGWGDATYLSNDDTMSLSSAQRTIWAIENYQPIDARHIREHELMNYFSFETAPVAQGRDFSVRMELDAQADAAGRHGLAIAVQGRPVGHETRRNANLTLVVDRSGSMREEGRMDYLKRGLRRMTGELRDGDIINIVSFDHRVCVPLRNYVVGRDDPKLLMRAIDGLKPSGNTNLFAGLAKGYELADAAYRDAYTNRVLLITDALVNRGETDARVMAMAADWYDSRRIRLSGIGVGREFDDHLLDRMTEKGRGAYVFLGSAAEVDAVFGPHFVSMIETTANDVHFRLHLPPSLRMQQFHGEEASTDKSEVQAIHYFANTSQLFLADLEAWRGEVRRQDEIMLEIEYMDPESGEVLREDYAFPIADIAARGKNLDKSRLVSYWIGGVREIAARTAPPGWRPAPYGWEDAFGWDRCQEGRVELDRLAEGLDGDREVVNLLRLWERQCERFARPRKPGRKPEGDLGWPAAKG